MKLGIKFAGVVLLTLMVPVWAVAEVNLHPHGSVKTLKNTLPTVASKKCKTITGRGCDG